MKKVLARILLTVIALFLLVVIAKAVNSEELVEKMDPLSLGNIQEMGTDSVSIINRLEQDRLKEIAFLKNITGLWIKGTLNDGAFVEMFSSIMDNLLIIDLMSEDYQLNYLALFEIKKSEVPGVQL